MRADIYVRISRDKVGAGLGVERQEADCRTLAAREGLEVCEVLSDNDLSAYSGKPRPAYARLLDRIRSGAVDLVIAWHTDRLHRSPVELEDFIAACEIHNVSVRTVQAGAIDLSSSSGRMGARIYGAVARHEVEHAIERVQAAKLQAAKAGKPSGGNRAYGYHQNGMEFEPAEQAIVLEMAKRIIDGESFNTIAADLNDRGVPTAKGNQWRAINVRNVLASKRNIGIRVHNGHEYSAVWPRMFDEQLWQQLSVAMAARQAMYKQRGPTRRHLLTGFAFCGLCGNRLNTKPNGRGQARYYCMRRANGHPDGCGKVARLVEPVDYLITECVLYRLDSPELNHEISRQRGAPDNDKLSRLLAEQQAQQGRLAEIADDYATTKIDKAEYQAFKSAATARLEALQRDIEREAAKHSPVALPADQTVRAWWETASLAAKRQVLSLLVDKVVIKPSPMAANIQEEVDWHGWRFVPEDVDIRWKA